MYYKETTKSRAVYDNTYSTGATLTTLDYSKSAVPVVASIHHTSAEGLLDGYLNFTFGHQASAQDTVSVSINTSAANKFTYVGADDTDQDGGLRYNVGQASTVNIANWQENTRSTTGAVIHNPDSTFRKSSGEFLFDLPKDVSEFKINMVLEGNGATTGGHASTGAVTLSPIAVGMAILDKDATLGGTTPYIVVGGPCANTVAATLMNSGADCVAGFTEGKATIKLFTDKNALLVAGFSGTDTQGAARVLAYYKDYASKFMGTELQVATTNLASLSVTSVQ